MTRLAIFLAATLALAGCVLAPPPGPHRHGPHDWHGGFGPGPHGPGPGWR